MSVLCRAGRHAEALCEIQVVLGPDVEITAPLRDEARRLAQACEEAVETQRIDRQEEADSWVRITFLPSPPHMRCDG